jgi:hypothetical protein
VLTEMNSKAEKPEFLGYFLIWNAFEQNFATRFTNNPSVVKRYKNSLSCDMRTSLLKYNSLKFE